MEMTGSQRIALSQQKVWEALNDVAVLQASIPGCESITATAENQYELLITAAVGPVKAKFKGRLALTDIDAPRAYSLVFEGQGGAAGHGKGKATVRLDVEGPDETLLAYTATAQVGGKLAQIGSRLVDMAAQKMAGEFFTRFEALLAEKYAPPVVPAADDAAGPDEGGLGSRLKAGWNKVLGRDEPT